jgi:hypothetical protein
VVHLRQVASKVGSNLLKATVSKGRCTFGQLKKNIGKFLVSQDSSSPRPMESPSPRWSQELAPTIMATVQDTFWEVGAKSQVHNVQSRHYLMCPFGSSRMMWSRGTSFKST